MRLTKTYVKKQLETLTIRELAEQIADELERKYRADGTLEQYETLGVKYDRDATVNKFYAMISPLTEKTN